MAMTSTFSHGWNLDR